MAVHLEAEEPGGNTAGFEGMEAAAPRRGEGQARGSRSVETDKYYRSDDHADWVQRCEGCLPVIVRPHRCVGFSRQGGWVPRFFCQCDEADCRTAQVAAVSAQRRTTEGLDEAIALLLQRSRRSRSTSRGTDDDARGERQQDC